MKIRFAGLLLLVGLMGSADAETVSCPDLSAAVQVAACPSDEELQFTFSGYCSDNARVYDKPEKQLCTDFTLYRSLKNVALWETRDGRFSGYVSCEPDRKDLRSTQPVAVTVDKQGSVTRVSCRYNTGNVFTYRSKAQCVAGNTDCARDPAACKVECN